MQPGTTWCWPRRARARAGAVGGLWEAVVGGGGEQRRAGGYGQWQEAEVGRGSSGGRSGRQACGRESREVVGDQNTGPNLFLAFLSHSWEEWERTLTVVVQLLWVPQEGLPNIARGRLVSGSSFLLSLYWAGSRRTAGLWICCCTERTSLIGKCWHSEYCCGIG